VVRDSAWIGLGRVGFFGGEGSSGLALSGHSRMDGERASFCTTLYEPSNNGDVIIDSPLQSTGTCFLIELDNSLSSFLSQIPIPHPSTSPILPKPSTLPGCSALACRPPKDRNCKATSKSRFKSLSCRVFG
jgi:hypothetical protein